MNHEEARWCIIQEMSLYPHIFKVDEATTLDTKDIPFLRMWTPEYSFFGRRPGKQIQFSVDMIMKNRAANVATQVSNASPI
jgi:hypothetical protein